MTPQEQLDAAREALHLLLTGQAATVYLDQNGERLEYQAANANRLQSYIRQLEREVAGTPNRSSFYFNASKGV